MCHHHKPTELLAERRAEAEAGDEEESEGPPTPTQTPPADD